MGVSNRASRLRTAQTTSVGTLLRLFRYRDQLIGEVELSEQARIVEGTVLEAGELVLEVVGVGSSGSPEEVAAGRASLLLAPRSPEDVSTITEGPCDLELFVEEEPDVDDRLRDVLEEQGFRPNGRVFERPGDGLVQLIELQPGCGPKKHSFTVNVGWRYTVKPVTDEAAFDCRQRIGRLLGDRDIWFSRADATALDDSLDRVKTLLDEDVLPFLDEHRSIAAVLDAFEAGELSARTVFGSDSGWQNYNLAFCYLHVGNVEKAKDHLQKVVELVDEIDPKFETKLYLEMLESARERFQELHIETSE